MVQLHGKRFFYIPWTNIMLDGVVVLNITYELTYNEGRLDAPNHSYWYDTNIQGVESETGTIVDVLTIHAIFRSLIWEADPTDGAEVWLDEFDEDGRDDCDFWTWQTLETFEKQELPVIEAWPEVPDFEFDEDDDDD